MSNGGELRFLLDQGFPKPRLGAEELQGNATFVHLSEHDPSLSRASTPDWMLYLVAQAGGYSGVITKDVSQVEQQEELIALTHLRLSVVTWKKGIDDPVTAWALIVAYMPGILHAITRDGPRIFLLPVPRLIPAKNILRASDKAREMASKMLRTSYAELRAESVSLMERELSGRGRNDLASFLHRNS